MAYLRRSIRSCCKILSAFSLLTLIALFCAEIYLIFSEDTVIYGDDTEEADSVRWLEVENRERFQQGDGNISFDYPEVDENWIDGYSEEGVYFDELEHALKNLKKPAAYAAKHKLPIIMWWTPFTLGNTIKRCSLGECFFTEARKFQTHPRTKVFMFYGTSFTPNDLPLPRLGHHEWALFHEESPKNNPILHHQTTMELFNHTSTFRRSSDYPLVTQMLSSLEDLMRKPKYDIHEKSRNGLAAVVYVQSGCNPPSDRDQYVAELMRYIKVDSYGTCLHNKDLPEEFRNPLSMDDKGFHNIIAKYKFTLSFENAICEDYVTEKLWRPLILGSVPVYKGSPTVQDWMPNNHSIIVVDDFSSPKELADFIVSLDQSDEDYAKYLEFKKKGITNTRLFQTMKTRPWGHSFEEMNYVTGFECFVCNRIHENFKRKASKLDETIFAASQEHYGCPRPEKYHFPLSANLDESEERDLWGQEYDQTLQESKELNVKVKSNWYF
ncbi:alpha-(1,3)-fucosyltransferase 10-like isoform X1 [Montipora capricornis]|uniref:alpha-(1,3)-fucosyltransferase 10-like isoform X1 n=1 Tax=Montipora foliosa TaxID=591990 RepID=UPI0035F1C765